MPETTFDTCRVLAYFLGKYDPHEKDTAQVRNVIVRDLLWHMRELGTLDRAIVMANAWYHSLSPDQRPGYPTSVTVLNRSDLDKAAARDKIDVAIVTILECELHAVLLALGREDSIQHGDDRSGPYQYWFQTITDDLGSPMKLLITMIGRSRNVPCAICVEHLLHDFDVGLIILVGIAAGPQAEVGLGDVVFADRVFDYEHVRLEVVRFHGLPLLLPRNRPRPEFIGVKEKPSNRREHFKIEQMRPLLAECLERVSKSKIPDLPANFAPKFHHGTVAAGEKLIADGSLKRMHDHVDQRIRAGDQEDSGFAQSAEHNGVNWCVFRGISDFGDPKKKHPQESQWQFVAALDAACSAITFIKKAWGNIPHGDIFRASQ